VPESQIVFCDQNLSAPGAWVTNDFGKPCNEWADTNRIIVLYPQAHATTVSELTSLFNTKLQGCWNWWGYGSTRSS